MVYECFEIYLINKEVSKNKTKTMKQILTIILFICSFALYSQEIPRKPISSDVRSYNQSNLIKIELGMTKKEVVESMGGIKTIQTYTSRDFMYRVKGDKISNPYSRDLKMDKEGNSIEILWYYTDKKEADGAINKDELTPIILEENLVVGMGWGFYQDYAKRKEITIDIK